MAMRDWSVRDIRVAAARFEGSLRDGWLAVARLDVGGAVIAGHGAGSVIFTEAGATDFPYDISHADLSRLQSLIGGSAAGLISTQGRITGPRANLHAVGNAKISSLDAYGVQALTLNGQYDVTAPGDIARMTARVTGDASFLNLLGQSLQQASGTVTVAGGDRIGFDLQLQQGTGRKGAIA